MQVSELEWLSMLMSLLVVLLALGTVMISFIALRTSVHWLTLQVRTSEEHTGSQGNIMLHTNNNQYIST